MWKGPFRLGIEVISRGGHRDSIRLLLGPSCNPPPRVPNDVAGLESIVFPLSLASDDFGRPRPEDVGGLMPLPTLAEKMDGLEEAVEMLLENPKAELFL